MKRTLLIILLLAALGFAADTPFTDPSPPAVKAKPAGADPSPRDNPEAKVSNAPRALAEKAVTHDWPSFLGPSHNMTSGETPLLADLAALPKVWEMKRGSGYAAPAILGDRLVLFHRIGNEEVVECIHRESGRRYWKHAYPTAYEDRYGYSDGPRCPPVIDGRGRVFTYGAEGKLTCLDLASGHVYWQRNLLKEFKLAQNFFGVGATPLIDGDLLIVNVGADGGPCVAAFDCATGKMAWGAGRQWGPSYASPIPAEIHGKRRILVFAGGESAPPAGGLLCIDPATGALDFELPHRGKRRESVNASSPLVLGDRVFISECYGAGGAMIQIDPDCKPKVLWRSEELGTHFMTAIHKDGHLYGFDGHGPLDCPLVCLDAATGKEKWRHDQQWTEEIDGPQGKRRLRFGLNRSFLLHADGRTLCLSESGHLLWLDLNPKGYRELSRVRLFTATESWTPPVLSRGLLYICQNTRDLGDGTGPRLICYDLRGK